MDIPLDLSSDDHLYVVDWARPLGLIGTSEPFQRMLQAVATYAPWQGDILLEGPSGAGKGLVSRAVHYLSTRQDKPFVTLNCTNIPDSLLPSIVDGHDKGSFTGATKDREGLFEHANGGTLFLNEVQDLPRHQQPQLLEALEGYHRRVGGDEYKTDVRIVAASSASIPELEAVLDGPLFHRISGRQIHVPGLNERGSHDIYLLMEHAEVMWRSRNGYDARLSPEAYREAAEMPWLGNVRQLVNWVESKLEQVAYDHMNSDPPDQIKAHTPLTSEGPDSRRVHEACEVLLWKALHQGVSLMTAELQRYVLGRAYELSGGNASMTARMLASNRTTVTEQMRKHGIGPYKAE